jgi:hypothetical protein
MIYCFKFFIPATNGPPTDVPPTGGPPTGGPPTSGPSGKSFNNISFQLIIIVRDKYSEIFSKINFNIYSLGLDRYHWWSRNPSRAFDFIPVFVGFVLLDLKSSV